MNRDVDRLLSEHEPAVAALARNLYELILAIYPDATVSVDGRDIGFGSGTGYKGLVFVVTPYASHVNLGVFGGASLPDPAGLMEGSGKLHRHVKVRHDADVRRPELRELMVSAVQRR